MVLLRVEHSGLLADPLAVASEGAGEGCKRMVGHTLQGTNVDNLFDAVVVVVVVGDDFVKLLQLVPCRVSVGVEWMVVWSFVH